MTKREAFFQIIIVSYNAGEELAASMKSVADQTFEDWHVLIKDGGSTDGSLDTIRQLYGEDERVQIVSDKDSGIYDAMNEALNILSRRQGKGDQESHGPFVYFLNCGDYLYDNEVLSKVHESITACDKTDRSIFYGDIFERATGQRVASSPVINDFTLYRNVPCHQACFYDLALMLTEHFDSSFSIRADYEQFLRCIYMDKADTHFMPLVIASYQGGGFSEKGDAAAVSERERKEIVGRYMPASKVRKYDLIRMLTLAPLRSRLARNPISSGAYNQIKSFIYKHRQ